MNNNYKYYENDFELAVLDIFCNSGWNYECGYDLHREKDEIIITKDFINYLKQRYGSFSDSEIEQLKGNILNISSQSLYRLMKDTYTRLIKGFELKRDDGSVLYVQYFDFENEDNNIFKVVNQFEFSEYKDRRPDIIVFINGIPVSVYELKNPADENVSIKDAYDQTHIRYSQDIPSLMKFDFINVISDGANTRYGSLFSSYEFYFKWNSTDGDNYYNSDVTDIDLEELKVESDGIGTLNYLIEGLFNRKTLLNVLKNYIYIPDNSNNDLIILPKYYQYYGSEKMYYNIINQYHAHSGKGGTFWGSTGCGKSYIMLFLSKRLTTSLELNKPTIVILTDRNDLDDQLSKDFENAKEYLIDDNSVSIKDRKDLKEKLANIRSGGIYLK